jgi:hypothetical protein
VLCILVYLAFNQLAKAFLKWRFIHIWIPCHLFNLAFYQLALLFFNYRLDGFIFNLEICHSARSFNQFGILSICQVIIKMLLWQFVENYIWNRHFGAKLFCQLGISSTFRIILEIIKKLMSKCLIILSIWHFFKCSFFI